MSDNEIESSSTFHDLGLHSTLCEMCKTLHWNKPTPIQKHVIPHILKGEQDIIGIAETGSGKTGAYVLPILHKLILNPQPCMALIITKGKELIFQIAKEFELIGGSLGIKTCQLIADLLKEDAFKNEQFELAAKPHIVLGMPSTVKRHLKFTKGFNSLVKIVVFDEADALDCGKDTITEDTNYILNNIKSTLKCVFSATLPKQLFSIFDKHLKNPIKVNLKNSNYETVVQLQQYYVFIPQSTKIMCLANLLLNKLEGKLVMVFCKDSFESLKLCITFRNLGINAIPLNNEMSEEKRLEAINKCNDNITSALISSDIGCRGLDIKNISVIINYDLPYTAVDYIHRVGRTARAGQSGTSITFVTEYSIEKFLRIEHHLLQKLPLYEVEQEYTKEFQSEVELAKRKSEKQLKSISQMLERKPTTSQLC